MGVRMLRLAAIICAASPVILRAVLQEFPWRSCSPITFSDIVERSKASPLSNDACSFLVPLKPDLSIEEYLRNTTADAILSPFDDCRPTTQVRVIKSGAIQTRNSSTNSTNWILQSLDSDGIPKTVGGDEFYVRYRDEAAATDDPFSTLVALVTDRHDGLYELDFFTTPRFQEQLGNEQIPTGLTGRGTLSVHFTFTCGLGSLPPPSKNDWRGHGQSAALHQAFNVSLPPYSLFQKPQLYNFSKHPLVISFGDSLNKQFVMNGRKNYLREGLYYRDYPGVALGNNTLSIFLDLLETWHGDQLRSNPNNAIILGAGAWSVIHPQAITFQGRDFYDHLSAVRDFARTAKERYPNNTIYWKTISALHPENYSLEGCKFEAQCGGDFKYLTESRSRYLYRLQRKIISKLGNIPMIDVYQATYLSLEQMVPNDARHYSRPFNHMMLHWFYP